MSKAIERPANHANGADGAKAEKRTVPAAALRFSAGVCEFGEAEGESKGVPVTVKARDGGVVDHWYWGRVVHDLGGMQLHKDRLALDYNHFPDEVIGYLDKIDTKSGDLMATGAIVPFAEKDRASEVIFRAKAGTPYEASIAFDGPLRVERVDAGVKLRVNGRDAEGPLMVFRQWSLRGVAVCPYGADRNTKTQLAAGQDGQIEVTIFDQESTTMTKETQTDSAQPNADGAQASAAKRGPDHRRRGRRQGDPAAPAAASRPTRPPASAGKETKPADDGRGWRRRRPPGRKWTARSSSTLSAPRAACGSPRARPLTRPQQLFTKQLREENQQPAGPPGRGRPRRRVEARELPGRRRRGRPAAQPARPQAGQEPGGLRREHQAAGEPVGSGHFWLFPEGESPDGEPAQRHRNRELPSEGTQ